MEQVVRDISHFSQNRPLHYAMKTLAKAGVSEGCFATKVKIINWLLLNYEPNTISNRLSSLITFPFAKSQNFLSRTVH